MMVGGAFADNDSFGAPHEKSFKILEACGLSRFANNEAGRLISKEPRSYDEAQSLTGLSAKQAVSR
jgi:hypothetical protein